jgi:sulfate/thiosulfate transport system substrate-binding protein
MTGAKFHGSGMGIFGLRLTESLRRRAVASALFCAILIVSQISARAADISLLNVSYDPTREFFRDFDAAFAKYWQQKTGQEVRMLASHGGSGKQARAVIDGLQADVVTLALPSDIDAIVKKSGFVAENWREKFPNNASPYASTIVFLVRRGNPKSIKDWSDLVREGVEVITPNPKTSGGARVNYLAAWAWAHGAFGGDEAKIREYIAELYVHVPVLDTGARAATTTFVQREIGDVLLSWENEAYLALDAFSGGDFEIVVPQESFLAEPPVAVVEANVDAHGTREVAEAYLGYLFSPEGQTLIAKHHYRPAKPELIAGSEKNALPNLKLVTIDDPMFGGWPNTQKTHFDSGGVFDQLYRPGRR